MLRPTTKREVIRQLATIADGTRPGPTTIIEEYQQCPDWQLAASILARGLSEQGRDHRPELTNTVPPAWLPPML